jgi:hypothetical protein
MLKVTHVADATCPSEGMDLSQIHSRDSVQDSDLLGVPVS